MNSSILNFTDPLRFAKLCWPDNTFYREQRQVIYSVKDNDETYVVAGNQLGKDYVAGFICPWFFMLALMLKKTCRIITTSVAEHHLVVLWGEIGRFVTSSRFPLLRDKDNPDAPLVMNHMELRYAKEAELKNPLSYCRGRVSKHGEGLAGHHAEMTLAVVDEASGVDEVSYKMFQGWAKRMLIFGNPNPCSPAHFFHKHVKAGDLVAS